MVVPSMDRAVIKMVEEDIVPSSHHGNPCPERDGIGGDALILSTRDHKTLHRRERRRHYYVPSKSSLQITCCRSFSVLPRKVPNIVEYECSTIAYESERERERE